MTIKQELLQRYAHASRIIRAGFLPLWVLAGIITILFGGSVVLALTWGIKNAAWGLVIGLLLIVVVVTEGSYRESRDIIRAGESPRLKQLRELSIEGQIMRARLPEKGKRGLVGLPGDLLRDFTEWKARTVAALEPWPSSLAQFSGQVYVSVSTSMFETERRCNEIEQRTKVLDQIVTSLAEQGLG